MNEVNDKIYIIDKAICDNIKNAVALGEELLAQNIMAQLRNFVNAIAVRIYSDYKPYNPKYQYLKDAMNYIRSKSKYSFLNRFDKCLQPSVSHFTLDGEGSARLMYKYIDFLYEIKKFLKEEYGLEVLHNIEEYPLNSNNIEQKYYTEIAEEIEKIAVDADSHLRGRFYILNRKPFFAGNNKYYELTIAIANDYTTKFDRIIAFSKLNIPTFYATKLSFQQARINILNNNMKIYIIDKFSVSIRPCEFNNFFKIIGYTTNIQTNQKEYRSLMKYLTNTGETLTDLVTLNKNEYNHLKLIITFGLISTPIFIGLDKVRNYLRGDGKNILKYLLLKMNNMVIKNQYCLLQCCKLNNLFLKFGTIPFDHMPYVYSLVQHTPKLFDLLLCINSENRQHEFLCRYIRNNTEINGHLYTHIKDLSMFKDIDNLIDKFNGLLYEKHKDKLCLCKFYNYVFINEYESNTYTIINKLINLSSEGIKGYTESVDSWLSEFPGRIDSDEKKEAIRKIFKNSHVALIYGAAGTGKSFLINQISQFFGNKEKLFLSNTHTAVENLRRKVVGKPGNFRTIKKFLLDCDCKYNRPSVDILFIDECSMVSNKDMVEILNNVNFNLLVLVGDVYQIESIKFGNWFLIAKSFIPKTSIVELTVPYRTDDEQLLLTWESVRTINGKSEEFLNKYKYSEELNEDIFEKKDDDEIVLCLNYDGLYGVNNINKFLQENNRETAVEWNVEEFKVGDPIIFNESKRFEPLLYNNLKGKILDIGCNESKIWFTIEIEKVLNGLDVINYDLELLKSQSNTSVIKFYVNKNDNNDSDDDELKNDVVPFQVAYAISIHKAQGLEFNSVKIVVTNAVEEKITHNIFYTAITRSKKNLKIYWNKETECNVLSKMELKENSEDAKLLSRKYNIQILNMM